MRYVDTGSRDPKHALGTWLADVLMGNVPVVAARIQTGYVGADALGSCESTLQVLAQSDGHTRFLVGSNGGQTPRAAIADLLKIVGQPRPGLQVGVVSFQSGLYHPKVFHFERADGSSMAYVGSANLTVPGTSGLNVESALIVDTKQGDPQAILTEIADAVDAWFIEQRLGLYPVGVDTDLDPLVNAGVLGVAAPPRTPRTVTPARGAGQKYQPGHSLKPLVAIPATSMGLTPKSAATAGASPGGGSSVRQGPTPGAIPLSQSLTAPTGPAVEHWSKKLSPSDAQRRAGHQSALIALTQGDYVRRIDQTSYFRNDLFNNETWVIENTPSKYPLDVAYVPMRVSVDGVDHGELEFRISHALHRESGTNSPTTELHLEPVLPLFAQTDMSGKTIAIERFADNSYALTIT